MSRNTAIATERERLAQLMRERALTWESVVLSSGKRSPYYLDSKQVLLDPEGAELAGLLGYRQLRSYEPRAVGGLTMGADPIVCAITAAAWAAGDHWTAFFVRKEPRKHGLQNWIEGPFIGEGTPVCIVDDVLTTGSSLLHAIDRARAQGAIIRAVMVVVDREEGGKEAVEAAAPDAEFSALFTASDLLADKG
jgi:orotate phosphoribosyltransferase